MRKKILLTGASGFIGRNLIENLSFKYQFITPSHQYLDLTDDKSLEDFFKNNEIEIVIHAANIGGTRKTVHLTNVLNTNLRMFLNLLKNKKYYKKMIFLGSGAEYDKRQSLYKVREEEFGKSIPNDDYGFYKYICSRLIENEKKIVNLRLFGIYGKYEDFELRFISNAICKVLLNLPITMRQNVFFDYLYIKDFVQLIEHFINHDTKDNFYNIGRGESIDLKTIAKKILTITDKKLPIKILKPGLGKEYSCDTTRLRNEVQDFVCTDFEKSIREMVSYYKDILPIIKKEDIIKYD